ncbi:MAG: SNF2-related protein, partial [Giesbergeria sp.]
MQSDTHQGDMAACCACARWAVRTKTSSPSSPNWSSSPVTPATFAWPDPEQAGNHAAALLLRDALRLKLRAGGGPFRSFGNIAVEPRAYQLVPLLMALRLATVRLLIADDVGIGKTIEAGLIARELLDRGEIARLAVLCPPHLVEQWQGELQTASTCRPSPSLSASASRLERDLPHGVGLFDQHPVVVVSLDYIKSERHREHFLSIAPECIIVDEAHTCASQRRRASSCASSCCSAWPTTTTATCCCSPPRRTRATKPRSTTCSRCSTRPLSACKARASADDPLRQQLARHFVQRRRKDIVEWQAETDDGRGFARRMKTELTYKLTGDWGAFFDAVQAYCREMAESVEQTTAGQRPPHLVRHPGPAALRGLIPGRRSQGPDHPAGGQSGWARTTTTKTRPARRRSPARRRRRRPARQRPGARRPAGRNPHALQDAPRLQALIAEAQRLSGKAGDPKLAALIAHVARAGQRWLCPRGVLPLRGHRALRGRRAAKSTSPKCWWTWSPANSAPKSAAPRSKAWK